MSEYFFIVYLDTSILLSLCVYIRQWTMRFDSFWKLLLGLGSYTAAHTLLDIAELTPTGRIRRPLLLLWRRRRCVSPPEQKSGKKTTNNNNRERMWAIRSIWRAPTMSAHPYAYRKNRIIIIYIIIIYYEYSLLLQCSCATRRVRQVLYARRSADRVLYSCCTAVHNIIVTLLLLW